MVAEHSETLVRAVFVEDLDPEELRAGAVVRLLRERRIEAIVSVRPWNVEATLSARVALEAAGVPVTLWPMLADDAGRWVNVRTARAMRAFVEDVLHAAGPAAVPRILLDFEPPIDDVRRVLRRPGELYRLSRSLASAEGSAELAALVDRLGAKGSALSAALVPFVLADGARELASRLLGVSANASLPSFGTAWIMAYTTLFAGYSRGLVDRRGALALLRFVAGRTRKRFGEKAALALGCVGRGALGDEAVYRSPAELREDVAVARRSGIERLALFDLGGVLARGEPEAWLEAFSGVL